MALLTWRYMYLDHYKLKKCKIKEKVYCVCLEFVGGQSFLESERRESAKMCDRQEITRRSSSMREGNTFDHEREIILLTKVYLIV